MHEQAAERHCSGAGRLEGPVTTGFRPFQGKHRRAVGLTNGEEEAAHGQVRDLLRLVVAQHNAACKRWGARVASVKPPTKRRPTGTSVGAVPRTQWRCHKRPGRMPPGAALPPTPACALTQGAVLAAVRLLALVAEQDFHLGVAHRAPSHHLGRLRQCGGWGVGAAACEGREGAGRVWGGGGGREGAGRV